MCRIWIQAKANQGEVISHKIYIPIQKVHSVGVAWRRALTWNKKRSKDLFVAGILLVIAVCFEAFNKIRFSNVILCQFDKLNIDILNTEINGQPLLLNIVSVLF